MRAMILSLILICTCYIGAPAPAAAFSSTCTSISVTSVSLTGYDSILNVVPTAVATVTYNCTVVTGEQVWFMLNAGNSGSFTSRSMQATLGGSTRTLSYQAYLDSGHTLVFGDGSGTTCVKCVNSSDNTGTFSIYLVDSNSQDPYQDLETAGLNPYTDSLTVSWMAHNTNGNQCQTPQ